ncbi:unnamed protein product, partial [Mesorhabditis belari]|uniref:C-type lectin domain-containing protein n=1 Tax=Mesorhabditis belari TaxID=2138241 RepID=A0AAF3J3M6_9BILA
MNPVVPSNIMAKSIFVLFGLISFVLGTCPQNAAEYGDQAECVYPIDAAATYSTSKLLCQQLGGEIISIRSVFENVLAASQAQTAIAGASQSYIGVIKNSNGTWTYADGRPLTYTNWAAGHPLANKTCAVLSSTTYSWMSVVCTESHTFVCSLPNQNCTDGWEYYDGNCYYFFNQQVTDKSSRYSVGQAESACQKMNAHLASIHSDDEYTFLKKQIATNLPANTCQYEQAIVGLTCGGQYAWYDSSPVDYYKGKGCNSVYTVSAHILRICELP